METDNVYADVEPIKTIRKYIADHGLKNFEFAEKIGMTRNNFYALLAGRRRMPLESIRLAVELGMPASTMLLPYPCETENNKGTDPKKKE